MAAHDEPSPARCLAVEVVRRVERGAFAAPALSAALDRLGDRRERGLLTDLVYGTLRHQLLLDACLAPRLSAPERLPHFVRNSLRLASFELLVRKTPVHAAVDQWVAVVKSHSPRLAGLANAVLRRVQIPDDLAPHLRVSLPQWLYESFRALLGEFAERAALGMLESEPLWLSAFGEGAAEVLEAEGCEVRPGPLSGSLSVKSPKPLGRLQAFRDGLVQPQNPAARLPVLALGAGPEERVLDLASGNGIKSALLAARGARVVAAELNAGKVERARANLERLGLEAEQIVTDLRRQPEIEPAGKVLLDAPCSGTGTLRGNPEIKLRLAAADVESLADLQREMLDTAAALTAPGGTLVYSVCALTPEEGPEQVRQFLECKPEFEALPLTLPLPLVAAGKGGVVLPEAGLDGFFIVRLKRQ